VANLHSFSARCALDCVGVSARIVLDRICSVYTHVGTLRPGKVLRPADDNDNDGYMEMMMTLWETLANVGCCR